MKKLVIAILGASTLTLTACAKGMAANSTAPDQSSASIGMPGDDGNLPPAGNGSVTPIVTATQPFPEDAQKFDLPWARKDASVVIDAYEGNAINWDEMAADKRVVAVIHRASSGLQVDSMYKSREVTAQARGYLWGAYHLGRAGDAIAQAKLFLSTIGSSKGVLMFLDLEDTSNSAMMNIPNAVVFLTYVYQQTGRIPVVYANQSVTLALNAALKGNALFTQARLWYARFKSDVTDFPKGIWPTYFLWQFSSEINCTSTGHCLYNVPGTAFDMDINVFYGTRDALAAQWEL
jgi:lysozyme